MITKLKEYNTNTVYPTKSQNQQVRALALEVTKSIAPLWDITSTVAVNPYFGFANSKFLDSLCFVSACVGNYQLPSTTGYKTAYENREISVADLEFAIKKRRRDSFRDVGPLSQMSELIHFSVDKEFNSSFKIITISDVFDIENGTDYSQQIILEFSKWAAAYFDQGQAIWKLPTKNQNFFTSWKRISCVENQFGISSAPFYKYCQEFSEDYEVTFEQLCERLQVRVQLSDEEMKNYFFKLLMTVKGWSSYFRKWDFEKEIEGDLAKSESLVFQALTVRLLYDLYFLEMSANMASFKEKLIVNEDLRVEMEHRFIWLIASESSYRRKTLSKLKIQESEKTNVKATMVFCIDVRSEVLRRHLEINNSEIRTVGFAGFFGLPISVQECEHDHSDQMCPVLLTPKHVVRDSNLNTTKFTKWLNRLKIIFESANNRVKVSGNSSYTFIESFGISFVGMLLKFMFRFNKKTTKIFQPQLDGIPFATQVNWAEDILKKSGLKDFLSPYIFLLGHGSESTNNHYASSLDCGACAGHNGAANAQVLAELLNNEHIRSQLADRGIAIPQDTVFVAGWHNTTLDELNVFTQSIKNSDQLKDIQVLKSKWESALNNTRCERLKLLDSTLSFENIESIISEVRRRATDWGEVRPEWGLAKNASFLAAPREWSRCVNLEGRTFLHDYDLKSDTNLNRLELIMTAPMVVANWINMQYFSSTVDNLNFGSGDKTLHNPIGLLGCVAGNSGDLLQGLSQQSVMDKNGDYHQPLRLQVIISAPTQDIDTVLQKHELVYQLAKNEWISLISVDPYAQSIRLFENTGWIQIGGNN